MAIQVRRGPYAKFDKRKLSAGEPVVVLQGDPFCKDGKAAYICFAAGDTKRMATYEDMAENIDDLTEDIVNNLTQNVGAAVDKANTAAANADSKASAANTAAAAANAAKTAADTATDAANKAAERANAAAGAIEGVIDDSRLKAVENKVTEIIEILSNVLGVS